MRIAPIELKITSKGLDRVVASWPLGRLQHDIPIEIDGARRVEQPLDVVKLVRSLESVERFKAVAAERTGSHNDLRLHITIDPL